MVLGGAAAFLSDAEESEAAEGHRARRAAEEDAAEAGMPRFEEDEDMTQETFNKLMDHYLDELKRLPPSEWSAEARRWAEREGVIVGDENGDRQYRSFVTREQLAVILKRLRMDA